MARETFCSILRYFRVSPQQAEAGSIFPLGHWGCWPIRLVGMRDPRIYVVRTIVLLILDFI